MYDAHVQGRKNVVLDKALRTNKIVSNLFPANVRDKMMQEAIRSEAAKAADDKDKYQNIMQRFSSGPRSHHFSLTGPARRRGSRGSLDLNDNSQHSASNRCRVFGSDPIAEHFPESTIM